MALTRFVAANAPWLGAGAALTFSSSFGQTFFISIFAGEIRSEFELSDGDWGGIYSLGTLVSAVIMLWAGTLTDRIRVKHLGTGILLGLSVICLIMALNPLVWMLPVIVFGLRFCGQGMLSHIAVVAMGRWFRANRGKAVALASTGYMIGESTLPFIFVALMGFLGWRFSWGVAAVLPLLMIPVLFLLLTKERNPKTQSEEQDQATGLSGLHWTRKMALRHWLFWMVAPAFLCPSIFGTALFFQQVHLTETKGWSHAEFVALFPLYVLSSILFLYATGWLIDRIGAARLFGFVLLPQILAFVIFATGSSLSTALFGFVILGVTGGAFNALSGTFWPEFYGTRHLGSIRAVATSLMVFGSAVGPGVTGYLIDFGIIFEDQLIGMAIISLASTLLALAAMLRARPLLVGRSNGDA